MALTTSTAFICKHCSSSNCIKKGNRGNAIRMLCKTCKKHQQTAYVNQSYSDSDEETVRKHHNEGLGIRSIGRILCIPATSVQMLMERKAAKLSLPKPSKKSRIYLLDELQTFVGRNKESHRRYVIMDLQAQRYPHHQTISRFTDTLKTGSTISTKM